MSSNDVVSTQNKHDFVPAKSHVGVRDYSLNDCVWQASHSYTLVLLIFAILQTTMVVKSIHFGREAQVHPFICSIIWCKN